jgi:hypothetical protein
MITSIDVPSAEKKHVLTDLRDGLSSLSVGNADTESKDPTDSKGESTTNATASTTTTEATTTTDAGIVTNNGPFWSTTATPTATGVVPVVARPSTSSSTSGTTSTTSSRSLLSKPSTSTRRVFRLLQSVSPSVPGSHANLLVWIAFPFFLLSCSL